MFLQRIVCVLQKGEIVAIVQIREPHVAPLSRFKPRVARSRKPTVHFVANDANTLVGGSELLGNGEAAIRRAVVYHNGFPVGEQLILQIAQGVCQVRFGICRWAGLWRKKDHFHIYYLSSALPFGDPGSNTARMRRISANSSFDFESVTKSSIHL